MDNLWILFYNFDKQCVNLHFFLLSLKKKGIYQVLFLSN